MNRRWAMKGRIALVGVVLATVAGCIPPTTTPAPACDFTNPAGGEAPAPAVPAGSAAVPSGGAGSGGAAAPAARAARSAIDLVLTAPDDVSVLNGRLSGTGDTAVGINSVLDSVPGARIRTLFVESRQVLAQRRAQATARSRISVPDLSVYFRVVLTRPTDTRPLLARLRSIAGVASATLAAQPVRPPTVTACLAQLQTYFDVAPDGLGAAWARTWPGATGSGVVVADLEYAWNTAHEDLSQTRAAGALIDIGDTPVDPFGDTNHGTAVQGILGADRNSFGISGLVPDAKVRMLPGATADGWVAAASISSSLAVLEPGDVLVVEQQTTGPDGSYVPAEWYAPVYDAIRTATAAGIIVVEAAGNGNPDTGQGVNLDDPMFGATFPAGKADSGAIIVGAGALCSTPARSRLRFSDYGQRVDVQGPGECVAGTGYGDLATNGSNQNGDYTLTFNGTSSATAVIGGIAAAISSAYRTLNGVAASPALVRSILVSTGTAQNDTVNPGHIGPRPDLKLALRMTDLTAPSVPGGLAGSLDATNHPVVNWTASTDNIGPVSYQVLRDDVVVATTSAITWTDTTAASNTTYSYQLRSLDPSGNVSAKSTAVPITTT